MLDRLKRLLPSLPETQARIAKVVVEQPRAAAEMSVSELAARAGASEPTVVRLARRLGYSGYRELRLHLARDLAGGAPPAHMDVEPGDTTAVIVDKVFARAGAALAQARERVSARRMADAAAALAAAKRIVFCGVGSSGIVAADAEHKFFRLGLSCTACRDLPTIAQAAAVLDGGGALVVVSHTGRWPGLAEALAAARRNGAASVALTGPRSPLAAAAGIALVIDVEEDTDVYTPMVSRLAHLVVIDTLQIAVAMRLGPAAAEALRRTKESLRRAAKAVSTAG